MNYTFEYMFIPQLVNNSNKDDFELDSLEVLDDFEFVEGAFEDRFPKESAKFDWKSLHITKEMSADVTYWLLHFPEPQKEQEAKWGLVLKKNNKPYVYYIFEKCEDGKFAIGSFKDGSHEKHGTYDADTTKEKFIEEAFAL